MKIIGFVLASLLVCSTCFATDYAVEKDDGSVVIINYVDGSKDSIDEILNDLGLKGKIPVVIDRKKLPSREDRKYWVKVGKTIVVDEAAKQEDLDKQTALDAQKAVVLQKMGISKEEYAKLNEKNVVGAVDVA